MKIKKHDLPGWLRLSLLPVFLLCAGLAPAQQKPQQTPQERKLDVDSWEHLWKTIYENHFDPTFGGVDWKAVRLEFLPKIEAAGDKSEARNVMREMLSRLKLTHFSIIPSELYEDVSRTGGYPSGDGVTGIQVRVLDGQALVMSVDPGSPAEKSGVKPGWEIIQIGEQEVPKRLASIAAEFEGRTLKDLVLADAVAGRLEGTVGGSVSVTFRDGGGQAVTHTLRLAEARGIRFQLGNLPPGRVWIETKNVGPDIGYIAFNGFVAPAIIMPPVNDAMKSFMRTAGIIIDLRGNTGGQAEIVTGIAGWLIAEKGRHFGTIQLRNQTLKLVVRPRPEVYAGRVAILVDGLSLCATEIFAGGLRDLGRARIFGSHTGGAALGGAVEKLPNGDGFMYAFANYVTAGGLTIEGNGLAPDVAVKPTREALLQGKDPALEAAINWIRKQSWPD
ncbi:MAG: PDZ domain-containing protein [Acidobacteriia bacterium]|nr:PDZ domain-containing protein [Terriglobia bacterium]